MIAHNEFQLAKVRIHDVHAERPQNLWEDQGLGEILGRGKTICSGLGSLDRCLDSKKAGNENKEFEHHAISRKPKWLSMKVQGTP